LKKLMGKLPPSEGGWTHSLRFLEAKTMARWGISPSGFWALDEEDRAFMIQFMITESDIASYESYLAERKARKRTSSQQ